MTDDTRDEQEAYDATRDPFAPPAAAPSEDAHHKTSEARRNALMEAEGSHSSASSTSPAGGGSEEPALSSPAPVAMAEGPTLGDWLGKYGVCFTIGKREDAVRELYTIAGKLDAARGKAK